MKRISIFILVITTLITSMLQPPSKTAASQNDGMTLDDILATEQEKNNKYLPQIEEQMSQFIAAQNSENSMNTASSTGRGELLTSYDLSGLYQVYIMDHLFITAVKETGSFADAITGDIQWKIPIQTNNGNIGLATMYEKDGKLYHVGNTIGEAAQTWMITEEAIRNAIAEADLADNAFLSMQLAHSYLYNTTFVYLTTTESEYLVPFSYYAEQIRLENGKLYTVSEIIDIFDSYFDEQQLIDNPNSNGGAPFRQQPRILSGQDEAPKTTIPVTTAVLVILVSVVGILLLVRYMKKQAG